MKLMEVFFVSTRDMCPVEIKKEAIKMKLAGKAIKEIMSALNIKNPTQVKIWWRWYRNGVYSTMTKTPCTLPMSIINVDKRKTLSAVSLEKGHPQITLPLNVSISR